jgi:transcriptional regulator with XRE-family HTH domain
MSTSTPPMLRLVRVLRGISQARLGQMAGVSQGTISRMEAGLAADTVKVVLAREKIAAALNFPRASLFPGDKEDPQ